MNTIITGRAFVIFVLNSVLALALTGFGPPKLVDREFSPAIRLTPAELRQWHDAAQPPAVSAHALLVYDLEAQRTLYSRNADVAMPPASLTKLMTALLVLEAGRLDDVVEVMAEDLVGGATMGLRDGESLTVTDLLHGMLIASGNDAAMALARHIGGDADAFVGMMNDRANAMGLFETHFVNPNGFDAEGHVSSASDIFALTIELLNYPLFREIVAHAELEVSGHSLRTTNELLGTYPGIDGVKTGTTPLAGQCLVASVQQDGRSLIIVAMGSDDRYADVKNLHQLYMANYVWVDGESTELSILNRLYDEEGRLIPLRAEDEPPAVLRHRWGDPELVSFRDITATLSTAIASKDSAGTIEWRMDAEIVDQFELTVR